MFDSHAHVSFYQFDEDREAVMARAREAGLLGWLEVGTDLEQSRKAVQLAESQAGVYATVGVHPSDIESLNEEAWAEIESLLAHEKVKAVGEVGLDFYRGGNLEEQLGALTRFIEIANMKGLPVVFHIRSGPDIDAHEELLGLLSQYEDTDRPRGVIHTYSGNEEQAKRYLEYGLYLSFSGVVTFPNAGDMAVVAAWAPVDKILIETDCPFLAPAPHRGKRNEPAYVTLVAEKIAELKNVPVENFIEHTNNSFKTLFQLS